MDCINHPYDLYCVLTNVVFWRSTLPLLLFAIFCSLIAGFVVRGNVRTAVILGSLVVIGLMGFSWWLSWMGFTPAFRGPGYGWAYDPEGERAEAARRELEPTRLRPPRSEGGGPASTQLPDLNTCAGPICTPVRIYFGTDRTREDGSYHFDFGPDRAGKLQLGRAIVTVPRAVDRKRGEITRPGWFERVILRVPPEGNPAKHFTIPKGGVFIFANDDEFIDAVQQQFKEFSDFKDHAFIFIHGFRTTFDDALYRTAQLAYDLGDGQNTFGMPFLYSWPSGGGFKDYKYDFDSARLAVDHLEAFLKLIASRSGATHLHIIAHSMGNWPILTALDKVAATAPPPIQIDQIILAAPDVDAIEFGTMASVISRVAKGVTLYVSSNDIAMKAAREVHHGAVRAGDVPESGPVIVKGIDTIDVSLISTDILGGHEDYVERRELLNDIALILRNGQHPPPLRMPILDTLHLKDLVYWRYPY